MGQTHWEHIVNVAAILESLHPGIAIGPELDCNVEQIEGVVRIVNWRRQEKQPTPDELKAAEPAALAALQAKVTERLESDTARDDAKRALSHLDTIIANAPTATTAQLRAAVEELARISKHHILATVGR